MHTPYNLAKYHHAHSRSKPKASHVVPVRPDQEEQEQSVGNTQRRRSTSKTSPTVPVRSVEEEQEQSEDEQEQSEDEQDQSEEDSHPTTHRRPREHNSQVIYDSFDEGVSELSYEEDLPPGRCRRSALNDDSIARVYVEEQVSSDPLYELPRHHKSKLTHSATHTASKERETDVIDVDIATDEPFDIVLQFSGCRVNLSNINGKEASQLAAPVDDIQLHRDGFHFHCPASSCLQNFPVDCLYEQFVSHTLKHQSELLLMGINVCPFGRTSGFVDALQQRSHVVLHCPAVPNMSAPDIYEKAGPQVCGYRGCSAGMPLPSA
jgi:hypothetical protein